MWNESKTKKETVSAAGGEEDFCDLEAKQD